MPPLAADLPALRLFLGAYLHQDWRDEYESTQAAFQDFLESEPHQTKAITAELRTVLDSDLSDAALRDMLREGGSFYVPDTDDLAPRVWLTGLLGLCAGSI